MRFFRVLVSRLDTFERVSHYLFEMSINGFPYFSSRPCFNNVVEFGIHISRHSFIYQFSHITEVYHDAVLDAVCLIAL
jgi:hypothetical protein